MSESPDSEADSDPKADTKDAAGAGADAEALVSTAAFPDRERQSHTKIAFADRVATTTARLALKALPEPAVPVDAGFCVRMALLIAMRWRGLA